MALFDSADYYGYENVVCHVAKGVVFVYSISQLPTNL